MKRSDWLFVIALVLIIVGAVALLLGKLTYEQFYALVAVALALIGGCATLLSCGHTHLLLSKLELP